MGLWLSLCAWPLLADPFARPPHVEKAVQFWRQVYAEIDTQSGLIHDNRNPEIVYELLLLDRGDTPRVQQRDIDRRLRDYRRLLTDMAQRSPAHYTEEQRRIQALWGANVDPEELTRAAKQVRFQRGQADRFREGLERQRKYHALVTGVLKEHGLPAQLAAIPHVESSYNPNVTSHAGAAGLWQLMPATGRRFLEVSSQRDERLDVRKATQAAARLLKHNYAVLQNWPLAITAYNRGLAGVRRAVRESGSDDIGVITRDYEGRAFGFASRNFYAAVLAASDVSSGGQAGKLQPGDFTTVRLEQFLSAAAIRDEFQLEMYELQRLNPELEVRYWNGEKLLPAARNLRLPLKVGNGALAALRSLEALEGQAEQLTDRYYRIQKGDKLALLANKLDTQLQDLMDINRVRSSHRIMAGNILRLPAAMVAGLPANAQVSRQYANLNPQESAPAQQVENDFALVYGVLRDNGAERDLHRYAFEAMGLASPSPWDLRVAASIDSLLAVPQALRAPDHRDNQLLAYNEFDHAQLNADPADYLVADDHSIEIQAGETLGHYAHWLGVSSGHLRKLNGLAYRKSVVIGKRFKLDFSEVGREQFETARREYHQAMQAGYFARHRIAGVHTHALSTGDNLWELATSEYSIPIWLLRQYNPDLDFSSVLPLKYELNIPLVEQKNT